MPNQETTTPKTPSQERTLTIFLRLFAGQTPSKQALTDEFQISPKAIQRDLMHIKAAIADTNLAKELTIPDQPNGTDVLHQTHPTKLNDKQIMAMCQVLLASRSLSKPEMTDLIAQLTDMARDAKRVEAMIKSDLVAYHGVPRTADTLDKIATITEAIQKRKMLQFTYARDLQRETLVRQPTAIFFSDLYFWMVTDNERTYDDLDVAKLNKFRLSLMENIKDVGSAENPSRDKHFEAGEFRKQTMLPFFGNPITLVFDYYSDPQYVTDRYPNTKVSASNGIQPAFGLS